MSTDPLEGTVVETSAAQSRGVFSRRTFLAGAVAGAGVATLPPWVWDAPADAASSTWMQPLNDTGGPSVIWAVATMDKDPSTGVMSLLFTVATDYPADVRIHARRYPSGSFIDGPKVTTGASLGSATSYYTVRARPDSSVATVAGDGTTWEWKVKVRRAGTTTYPWNETNQFYFNGAWYTPGQSDWQDFTILFGDCVSPTPTIFDPIIAVTSPPPILFGHLGDTIYGDNASNNCFWDCAINSTPGPGCPACVVTGGAAGWLTYWQNQMYSRLSDTSEVSQLLQTLPMFAGIDDHDYGFDGANMPRLPDVNGSDGDTTAWAPNGSTDLSNRVGSDSNATWFGCRAWAMQAYSEAYPSYPRPGASQDGDSNKNDRPWYAIQIGPVQVIKLDSRLRRDPKYKETGSALYFNGQIYRRSLGRADQTVLTDDQWWWLQQRLADTSVHLSIVFLPMTLNWDRRSAGGSQITTQDRDEVYDWISANGAHPVVMCSGDRHASALWTDSSTSPRIIEVLASPMSAPATHTITDISGDSGTQLWSNASDIGAPDSPPSGGGSPPPAASTRTFGVVRVTRSGTTSGTVTVEIRAETNLSGVSGGLADSLNYGTVGTPGFSMAFS